MLPTSLEAATARMMHPESIAREPEVFGNDFVEHYGGTREHEVRLWNQAVTNWEGELFFVVRFPGGKLISLFFFLVERYLELA
jgi:glutamine synthetase